MSINGKFSVDVHFIDKASSDGSDSVKTVFLQDISDFSTGKVAIVSGTAGTAQTSILGEIGTTTYRDASGAIVDFNSVTRVAFRWSGPSVRTCEFCVFDGGAVSLASSYGSVAISETDTNTVSPTIRAGGNTGTYTIVVYGT